MNAAPGGTPPPALHAGAGCLEHVSQCLVHPVHADVNFSTYSSSGISAMVIRLLLLREDAVDRWEVSGFIINYLH